MFADKIYTINLDIRQDRKIECIQQGRIHRFEQEFIRGVDGDTLNIPQLVKDGLLADHFLDPNGSNCTKGTYGCSFGHINAWKKAYDDSVEVALFLEDDFVISPFVDFDRMTIELKDYIMDCDWDILFLGKHKRYVLGDTINSLMVKTEEDWLDKPLATRDKTNGVEYWGAHAYLVRRETIKYLIDNYTPINMAVDIWLQYLTKKSLLKIYSLQETLVYQKSTLEMIQMGRPLTTQDRDRIVDSDTFHNHNRRGKYRWIQMPKFSSSMSKEEFMWKFNIGGIE
jgi:GR25 family glycosyltransferase involved in LPS biosynthesis